MGTKLHQSEEKEIWRYLEGWLECKIERKFKQLWCVLKGHATGGKEPSKAYLFCFKDSNTHVREHFIGSYNIDLSTESVTLLSKKIDKHKKYEFEINFGKSKLQFLAADEITCDRWIYALVDLVGCKKPPSELPALQNDIRSSAFIFPSFTEKKRPIRFGHIGRSETEDASRLLSPKLLHSFLGSSVDFGYSLDSRLAKRQAELAIQANPSLNSVHATLLLGVGWYHGKFSREEATAKLSNESVGTFLIRDNSTEFGSYVLTFKDFDRIKHHKINPVGSQFQFDDSEIKTLFPSPQDAVKFYMETKRKGMFAPKPLLNRAVPNGLEDRGSGEVRNRLERRAQTFDVSSNVMRQSPLTQRPLVPPVPSSNNRLTGIISEDDDGYIDGPDPMPEHYVLIKEEETKKQRTQGVNSNPLSSPDAVYLELKDGDTLVGERPSPRAPPQPPEDNLRNRLERRAQTFDVSSNVMRQSPLTQRPPVPPVLSENNHPILRTKFSKQASVGGLTGIISEDDDGYIDGSEYLECKDDDSPFGDYETEIQIVSKTHKSSEIMRQPPLTNKPVPIPPQHSLQNNQRPSPVLSRHPPPNNRLTDRISEYDYAYVGGTDYLAETEAQTAINRTEDKQYSSQKNVDTSRSCFVNNLARKHSYVNEPLPEVPTDDDCYINQAAIDMVCALTEQDKEPPPPLPPRTYISQKSHR